MDGRVYSVDVEALNTLLGRSLLLSPSGPPGLGGFLPAAGRLADLLIVEGHSNFHKSLKGGQVPDRARLYKMAEKLLQQLRSPIPIVAPSPNKCTSLQFAAYMLFRRGKIKMSMDCPGWAFLVQHLAILILDSWYR